jgi:hypothetical protein
LAEIKLIKQGGQVFYIAELAFGGGALSVPPQIVAEYPEVWGKANELIVPLPAVGDAGVDENDWLACAGNFVVDVCVVD